MLVKIAELKVKKLRDYHNSLVKTLKKDFVLGLDYDGINEAIYSIYAQRKEFHEQNKSNAIR